LCFKSSILHLSKGPDYYFSFKKSKSLYVVYTATSREMADQSRFLIGIMKWDEGDAEIHDGQALDLGEVGRRENAPAIRTKFVDTWLWAIHQYSLTLCWGSGSESGSISQRCGSGSGSFPFLINVLT
jgi:hypothetical protein